MIKLEMPEGMVETTLNIKGVVIHIKRCENDLYEININDTEHRFMYRNIPKRYNYISKNNLSENYGGTFWCSGKWTILRNRDTGILPDGGIINGKRYDIEIINTILESIVNGIAELERLSEPEIIKVGNVTITKQKIGGDKVKLSVDGLISCIDYPHTLTYNSGSSNIAYLVSEKIALYDGTDNSVWINKECYFPTKDFECTSEQANTIIDIITKSEEKLAKYYEEKNKIKIGDKVEYTSHGYDYEGIVIDIENDYCCIKKWFKQWNKYVYDEKYIKDLKKID